MFINCVCVCLCLVYILSSYYEYLDWNRFTFLVMLLFIVYRLLLCGIRKCCVSWNQITLFGCVIGNDNSNCVRLYYVIFGLLFFFSGGKKKTKTNKFCTFWEGVSVYVVCMYVYGMFVYFCCSLFLVPVVQLKIHKIPYVSYLYNRLFYASIFIRDICMWYAWIYMVYISNALFVSCFVYFH